MKELPRTVDITTLDGVRTLHYLVDTSDTAWFPLGPTSKILLTKPRRGKLRYRVQAGELRSANREEAGALWSSGIMAAAGRSLPVLVTAAGLVDGLERCLLVPSDVCKAVHEEAGLLVCSLPFSMISMSVSSRHVVLQCVS